jgi:hypothetical protein
MLPTVYFRIRDQGTGDGVRDGVGEKVGAALIGARPDITGDGAGQRQHRVRQVQECEQRCRDEDGATAFAQHDAQAAVDEDKQHVLLQQSPQRHAR